MGWLTSFLAFLITVPFAVAEDAALPTPQRLLEQAVGARDLATATGEQFTWFAAYRAHAFLDAFEATGDVAWMEAAQTYYDHCLKQGVSDDPDGFPGTIGADIGEDARRADTTLIADTVVGDANIALPLVHFAELVKAHPALAERFGARAQDYIAVTTRMCWEKWNRRGCYYQDAHGFGSYHTHPFAIAKDDRTRWVPRPDHLISDNLNKHYKMGLVLLRLYRLTGQEAYRERVEAIYGRAKAMFRLLPDEDRIVWNFWMPHGAYDVEGTAPKSWVGVHPSRAGYQEFEAGAFLAVYDAGLVFDRGDLERIVRTNRWMMANGLKNADGTAPAGAVWGALSRFDDGIRAAHEKNLAVKKDAIALAHLHQVLLARPGYDRLQVAAGTAPRVSKAPVQPGRRLIMALPIPDALCPTAGESVRLIAKVQEAGTVQVELLAKEGETVLGRLASLVVEDQGGGFTAHRWDGRLPGGAAVAAGAYRIRWTLNGESRTWPITIAAAATRERSVGPQVLAIGATLLCDFEKDLDARWTLAGGAAVAEGQAKSGTHALRLGRKQSARLALGDQEDLQVNVSFWTFDAGTRHGRKAVTGAAWGVRMADGNLFAIRQMWRPYLDGDADVAWCNTGENQWFSPHPTGLGRSEGWNHWTFALTGASAVVERDGRRLAEARLKPVRLIPTGAVGLVFLGTEMVGDGDLLVDDVTVQRMAAR